MFLALLIALACSTPGSSPGTVDTSTVDSPGPQDDTGVGGDSGTDGSGDTAESGPTRFKAIDVGDRYACGILESDDTLVCWGPGTDGAMNPPPGTFDRIALSSIQSCGLRLDGTLECWGFSVTTTPSGFFKSLATYSRGGCAARSTTGIVECWSGTSSAFPTPVTQPVNQSLDTAEVAMSRDHACWYDEALVSWCWGDNEYGQVNGNPGAGDDNGSGLGFTDMALGALHTCGIRAGEVLCWGADAAGQLDVAPGTYLQIDAGNNVTCGVTSAGSVECWGREAGDFDVGLDEPPAGSDWVEVRVGAQLACGRRSDGSVACWGIDEDGSLDVP